MLAFKNPTTSVEERLDEIVVMARDWKQIDHDWPAMDDIAWLRSVLAQFWSPDYPQPYIGTGPEDAMICLYWKSVEWTFTLEIDTVNKTGYLCRAPNQAIGEVELAVDVNLTGGEMWGEIASELGVGVVRTGNILAASLGQSVPKRRNTGSRISAQNKSAATGIISGRAWPRKRAKSRRIARYARGATFKSRTGTARRLHILHRGPAGSRRRNVSVRAGAA